MVTPSGRDWVELHAAQMRHAAVQAVNASNLWNRLNDEFMDFARRSKWDALTIARHKPANLVLNDAYGACQFWQGKAQMHAAVLQGELAAQALLGGGDPTGLLYQRDDDGPLSPSTTPHEGVAIVSEKRVVRHHDPYSGKADARLDATVGAVVRDVSIGVDAPVGADTSSPAGPSVGTTVGGHHRQPQGRPGPQPSGARAGARASGSGGTGATGPVPPALRGGGAW